MSVVVSAWAWSHAPVKSGELVVLLALADNAHDDGGGAYPSQEALAGKARMSDRQVRNCLRALEDKHIIERQGKTQGGVVVWRIVMAPDAVRPVPDPDADEAPEKSSARKSTSAPARTSGRQLIAGTPGSGLPTEPSIEPSLCAGRARAREAEPLFGAPPQVVAPPPDPRRPAKVNRRKVTPAEHDRCDRILDAFNTAAGTRYGAEDFRRAIILRCAEHPELSDGELEEVISRNFRAPWWTGPPSPAVIFGNSGIFERAMACNGVPSVASFATERDRRLADRARSNARRRAAGAQLAREEQQIA